ncbi:MULTISPECIES: anthrone oxygenase family protein [unclassified Devosia]|jgi:uncharacterized membrane protein|uniref:anthrone oxygenase family protein n=1 Tax=unclassified Devosia TaxID=196773 RepID=UPI0008699FE0|nr:MULTISPECIES: anthrone oxygenase family protein [unclassified Devosia]MBN9362974.1 DUF1772 domain-containing protein [Devosia sp.]ODS82300.1 MAG: hypothetical protein ABS47_22780 [Devosia sp. SCN 66-27]OJX23511.1 MAG: hypothetical protein BGO83_01155 [Devosia sp. 66-14]
MSWIDMLSIVVALGAALIGGTFFGFSNFVMPAIGRQPPAHGIAVMNAINVTVLNAGFLGAFMGTAILGLVLVLAAFVAGGSPWAAAGALIYVIGTFGVTMAINVPMNDRLAKFEAPSPEGAVYWATYLRDWTRWNAIRSGAAMLATLLLMISLMR